MTTRYRVEYALKIEWIKALLAVPFVLHSQPAGIFDGEDDGVVIDMASHAHRRYAEIMYDVEQMITDHIKLQGTARQSKLRLLVPSIGTFFTLLPLRDAFVYQDQVRHISSRRFVAPSFNDVRVILNTAQVMSLSTRMSGALGLVTFDGDVTLYDDGQNLHPDNPVVSRILGLMKKGVRIGIVTAAGYAEPEKYSARLYGLLHAIRDSKELTPEQRRNLIVMGGESSYLCQFDEAAACCLRLLPRGNWVLDEMRSWEREDIEDLLDVAERALRDCVKNMRLDAIVIRKERAVGIVPKEGKRFPREQLEETVLVTQKILEGSRAGKLVPFCAFNGGNDVFVDIGDKSWGVLACQRYFGGIDGDKTLHVGDQFLSAGSNDFKARLACTTAWIASPAETVMLLDEIAEHDATS